MVTPGPEHGGEPVLALIVARGRNGVIGRDGDLPWRLPEDLAFFKRVTMGKPVLMGRRTWESLPRMLPGRPHLVLTRNADYRAEGAELFTDLAAMLERGRALASEADVSEICVIGGAALYGDTLALAQRLYLTEVDAAPDGDVYFPHFDEAAWREIACEDHPADDRHAHAFRIRTLERKALNGRAGHA